MTPTRLTEIGQLLYGHGWVNPLAAALGINRRTMQAINNDGREIPPGVTADLADLCERRAVELATIAITLRGIPK